MKKRILTILLAFALLGSQPLGAYAQQSVSDNSIKTEEEETAIELFSDDETEDTVSENSLSDNSLDEEPVPEDDDPGRGRAEGHIDEGFLDDVNLMTLDDYVHNSRFDGYTIKNGIDVSRFQGGIDWNRVSNDGVEFAFVRLGYRGYGSAGTIVMDEKYRENIQGAANAGLDTGVYFFSQAISVSEAREEAEYVLSNLNGARITLPIVMDFEYASSSSGLTGRLYNANLSRDEATAICKEFCRVIEAHGYKAMVYANKDMLENHLNANEITDEYQIWLAHYTYRSDYEGDYSFWQCSSSEYVDGISGRVDRDFWYIAPEESDDLKLYDVDISDGVYTISSIGNGAMVLDISNGSISNGANIQLYTSNSTEAQRFYIHSVGNGEYILISAKSGKVLGAAGGSTEVGANIQQYPYNGAAYQRWKIKQDHDGNYVFQSVSTDMVMDIRNGSYQNGTVIQQYTWNGTTAQKFQLTASGMRTIADGTYNLLSCVNKGRAVDILNASKANGASVQVVQVNGNDAQKFRITYNGDGTYTMRAVHSGKALDVSNGSWANEAFIQQYDANGTAAQKWLIRDTGNGEYIFISAGSGKVLTLQNPSGNIGTRIYQYEFQNALRQKFIIQQDTSVSMGENVSVSEGIYEIITSYNRDKVLDVQGGNVGNGANIQIYASNGTDAQKFYVRQVSEKTYIFVSALSGRVIEAAGANGNGVNVQLNPYSGSDYQKWKIYRNLDGYYTFMCVGSGKVMDVRNGSAADGTNVQQYAFADCPAQKFVLRQCERRSIGENVYSFISALSGNRAIDISNGSKADGGNVQLFDSNGTAAQRFRAAYNGDGTYTLIAQNSGKALDVANGGTANGTNVQQYSSNGTVAQKWIIRSVGDGYYVFISASCGRVMDVSNGNSANGANIQIYDYNGTAAQRFRLVTQ